MAVLFLGTAVATSAVVIWQAVSNSKTTPSSSSSSSSKPATPASSSGTKTKLAGTQLAGFTPVSNVSQLQIDDTKAGTGAVVKAGATLEVLYTGAVASTGTIFQASSDSGPSPISVSLNSVITGWQKGIPGMRVGGTRRLLIPANEAYGATPPSGSEIPANAPLVFDVTVVAQQ